MQTTVRRLYDLVQVPDENAVVGIAFISGTGFRVGVAQNGAVEHMSAAAAWRRAREHDAEIPGLNEPTLFARALGLTAGKVRAMGLAGREPDGRA